MITILFNSFENSEFSQSVSLDDISLDFMIGFAECSNALYTWTICLPSHRDLVCRWINVSAEQHEQFLLSWFSNWRKVKFHTLSHDCLSFSECPRVWERERQEPITWLARNRYDGKRISERISAGCWADGQVVGLFLWFPFKVLKQRGSRWIFMLNIGPLVSITD